MRLKRYQKIAFSFTAILAAALLVIYIGARYFFEQQHLGWARHFLLQQAEWAGADLGAQRAGTTASLQEVVRRVGRNLGLRVTYIDPEGRVMADSEVGTDQLGKLENHLYRPEIQAAVRSRTGASERFSVTLRQDMLYAASALGADGHQGFIRVAVPLAEVIYGAPGENRLLTVLIWVFVLASAAVYGVSYRLVGPVREITAVAKGIALGDFSRRVHGYADDDLQELTQAINQLAEQAQSRIDELTVSRRRWEAVLLSMFDGLMVVDAQGAILLMNKTARDLFKAEGQTAGRRLLEVIRNTEIQDLVDRTLKLEHGVESRELTMLLPEERTFWVHATVVIRNMVVDGAVLVFHDITELRRLEKVRKDFVANVSHELRTPLASIRGYAETLRDGAMDDRANAGEFLKIIHDEAGRLARLVDDLLELSRIESGVLTPVRRPCHLRLIAERVVQTLASLAGEKNVAVHNDIPDGLPAVSGDEAAIAEVFHNLLDNAVKYNHSGGSVWLTARDKGGAVEVSVADNGIGIPVGEQGRIFERFYRVDKSRSRELGGTGLGLSIVKHIIESHDGEVWVDSGAGAGTAFLFTLPKI